MSHSEWNEDFIIPVQWGKVPPYCDSLQYLLLAPLQFAFPINLITTLIVS